MKDFRIAIASLPDRNNLVAEILYKGVQWVEISQESDELLVQLYSHPQQGCWEFPCDDAIRVLEQARKRLLGTGQSTKHDKPPPLLKRCRGYQETPAEQTDS